MLYEVLAEGILHCFLCHHHCRIADSKFGFCGVRENRGGKLYTHAYGEVVAAHIDPIEKKPLYHFLPGSLSFSIAAAGCNFRCGFCQNWQISQISRKDRSELVGHALSPEEVVKRAKVERCLSVSYTYTEPTIFFEYAFETSRLAKEAGLFNVFVTNGFMTGEALKTIQPYLDACNVDLKSFRDEFYKDTCRGRLEPVLESIRLMKEMGIWVEITTLVVPNENDSDEELGGIARFIAQIDPQIPWHLSRFHPDYQFVDSLSTPVETIRRAELIGKREGLRYIYVGNVPGEPTDTLCPKCHQPLIRRRGYWVEENRIKASRCPSCQERIPGTFLPSKL
jgi:pyruvate formate lyase activating enzyme